MTPPKTLEITRLDHAEGLLLPAYETAGAAGMDLRAAVGEDAPVTIEPGRRALIPTGLQMALPPLTEGQIRPRSGLALKHGVTVLNTPGTVDEDYRGEVKVLLINLGDEAFVVRRGERIAQFVVHAIERVAPEERNSLSTSARGGGGFGSTGR